MKTIFLPILALALASSALSQSPTPTTVQKPEFKVVSSVDPAFPPEAASGKYGETVRVLVQVNKKGKVIFALVYGIGVRCADRNDSIREKIKKAAEDAAFDTLFEPILKDGRPVEIGLTMTYRLTKPKPTPPPSPPDDTSNGVKMVKGGVINGKAFSLPKPIYPEAARTYHVGGQVKIDVIIGEDGRVLTAHPSSGHPFLVDSAMEAACGAAFSPTTLDGHPVKVAGIITYNFVP